MKLFLKSQVSVILMLALSFSLPAAHAQDEADPCASIGGFAERLMEKRQQGIAMSDLMKLVALGEGPQRWKSIARQMVIAAYEKPQYSVDANKADAVQRFRNEWELECYKEIS